MSGTKKTDCLPLRNTSTESFWHLLYMGRVRFEMICIRCETDLDTDCGSHLVDCGSTQHGSEVLVISVGNRSLLMLASRYRHAWLLCMLTLIST